MNCKPNDLAIIYRSDGKGLVKDVGDACIGHPVTVKYLRPPIGDGGCTSKLVWEIEKPFTVSVRGREFVILGIEDYCLRPIRDPGDDAQDETLRWKDVPLPAAIQPELIGT